MKIALIPARSGSKRLPHKNIKLLNGHPLIAYSIVTAIESKIFDKVIVCTDSKEYADIACKYGAHVPYLRNPDNAASTSPDIEWVSEAFNYCENHYSSVEYFSILRPTNPCRSVLQFKMLSTHYYLVIQIYSSGISLYRASGKMDFK